MIRTARRHRRSMSPNQLPLLVLDPPAAAAQGAWSAAEDRTIRAFYFACTRGEIAALLNRSPSAVNTRCWTLGLHAKSNPWTDEEVAKLREVYERATHVRDLRLRQLAQEFGRDEGNLSRKARTLGLVRPRPRLPTEMLKIRRPRFATPEELSAYRSETSRRRIAERGHPRGALGMKHTPEARAKMAAGSRRAWADPNSKLNSEEARQRRSDVMYERMREGKMLNGREAYSRCAAGRREDIGNRYFRSAWEANYARYLNLLVRQKVVASWDYECHTFTFDRYKRGTRSYTPDFKVTFPDGHHEWHEVKGWMDDASRVRLERMAKFYPEETVKVIGADWFRGANRNVAHVIPGWERGGKKAAPR